MDEAERRALEAREANWSVQFRMTLVVLVAALMMDVAVVLAVWRGAAPPTTLAVSMLASVTGGLGALAAVMALAWRAAARKLAEAGGRRDREQRARALRLLVLPLAAAVVALGATTSGGDIVDGEPASHAFSVIGAFVTLAIALPAMVMGWDGGARRARRYLEDELTRAFRARAMITGFWVLIGGVLVIYVIGLWRPDIAMTFMPLALWAGGATACLRFAQLYWTAGRDE